VLRGHRRRAGAGGAGNRSRDGDQLAERRPQPGTAIRGGFRTQQV